MALPTNTFATYEAIGNREDLSDEIWKISPTETPIFSALPKISCKAVNHEWQTQALDAVETTNARLEGDDASTIAATPTVRLGNICQISDKVARVTGTQQVVDHAGREDELGYQKMLKGQALKIDIDTILCGVNQAKNAGADATARKTASILSWIKTNTDKATAGSPADPSAADGTGTRTDGTQIQFTEARMKSVLQKIWTQGGKPNTVYCGGFNKQQFSTFVGRSSPVEQASSRKIVAAVDAYESDFGKITVTPSRNVRARDVLILENEKWAIAHLNGRKMVSYPLAKTGDSERAQMLSEYNLEARNEKASGGVFDCTVS